MVDSLAVLMPEPGEKPVRELRQNVRSLLENHQFADQDVEAILLGLDEAVMNAIEHAAAEKDPSVELKLQLFADRLLMEISDRGKFCFPNGANHTLPGDDAESGRGMFLIHHTMDEVDFLEREGGGTLVRLVKRR